MKPKKLTGELLPGNLRNVSSLIGEAQDVLNFFVNGEKGDLQLSRVKELSKQMARDLSSARTLQDRIVDELTGVKDL